MAEVARREVAALAGRRAVRALAADAGDHAGGGDAGRLRRRARTSGSGRLRELPAPADRVDERAAQPRRCWPTFGPRWVVRSRRLPRGDGAGRGRRCWTRCAAAAPSRRGARRTSSRCWSRARYEDGSPLSERDLRDELLTLLTDGPTSTSLAWTFERLLRNPEKLERAQRRGARRRRRRLPRRRDQGDAAAAPAGAGRRPPAAGADAPRRPRPARPGPSSPPAST